MAGKIFLSGGGHERHTFELDEVFLEGVNSILYIPIAWANEDFGSCLRWLTNAISQHRDNVKIEMLTDLNKDVNLGDYDAVYIGGGNTFKLLKKIRESRFDRKLLDYHAAGGTIYGGSAGAMIWGRDISIGLICSDVDVNEVGLTDTRGFDVLKGMDVQCHYRSDELEVNWRYVAQNGRNVVALPNESGLLLENGKITVLGTKPVSLITKSGSTEYRPNQELKPTSPKPRRSLSKV